MKNPVKNFNPKQLIPGAKGVARGTFAVNLVIALAIFIALNLVFKQITLRYDLTSNKQYSLSDETTKVLNDLKSDVQVTAYVDNYSRGETERLLKEYSLRQPKLKVEYVDVQREPVRAQMANVTKSGTVVFTAGQNKEVANVTTETEFTSALFKVMNPRQYRVLAWTGSGEKSLEDSNVETGMSSIGEFLKNNNFIVESKNELNDPAIPENIDVLLIAGPQNTLPQAARNSLNQYVDRGGKLFVMVDPLQNLSAQYGLEPVFERFGVEVQKGLVFEPRLSINGQPPLFAVVDFPANQITESLDQARFFLSSAVKARDNKPAQATVTNIVQTSADSWLETNFATNSIPTKDGNDTSGPLTVGLTSLLDLGENKQARMVLFADSDFPINLFLVPQAEFYNRDNIDLFINSMNWLVARENLYNIAPKERTESRVSLNDQQKQYASIGVLAGMPLAALLIGWLVVRMRKNAK